MSGAQVETWQQRAAQEDRPAPTVWRSEDDGPMGDWSSLVSCADRDEGLAGLHADSCAFPVSTPAAVVLRAQDAARSEAARMVALLRLHPDHASRRTEALLEAGQALAALRRQDDPGTKSLKSARDVLLEAVDEALQAFTVHHDGVVVTADGEPLSLAAPIKVEVERSHPYGPTVAELRQMLAEALVEVRRQDAALSADALDVDALDPDGGCVAAPEDGPAWVRRAWGVTP